MSEQAEFTGSNLRTRAALLIAALLVAIAPIGYGGKTPLAVMITAALALIALVLSWRLPPRWYGGKLIVGTYSILLGWSALSLIWTVNRFQTERWLIQLILVGIVFQLAYQLRQQPWMAARWWRGYQAIAVAIALYGGYLYVTTDYDRLTSLFYWPNPAAIWLIPALLYSLWRSFKIGATKQETLPAAIITSAFILTYSRSSYVLIAVVLAVSAWLLRHKKLLIQQLVLFVALVAVIAGGTTLIRHDSGPSASISSYQHVADVGGGATTLSDRWNYLKSTADIWAHHPLLGTGAGTYPTVHPQYQYRVISAGSSAHNGYAQTFAELGAVGGLALALLAIALMIEAGKALIGRHQRLAAIGVVVLLIHFGLDIDGLYPVIGLLTAVLAGMMVARRDARHTTALSVTNLLLTVIALTLAFSWLSSNRHFQNGQIYQENDDLGSAITSYQQASSGLMYDPDALTALGIAEYSQALDSKGTQRQQGLEQALADARHAEQQDPNDAQHYFLEARILRAMQQRQAAEAAYQKVLSLDPYNHLDYYADLGDLLLLLKQPQAADSLVQQALAKYDATTIKNRATDSSVAAGVVQLYLLRARAAGDQGQHVQAEAFVQAANALKSGK